MDMFLMKTSYMATFASKYVVFAGSDLGKPSEKHSRSRYIGISCCQTYSKAPYDTKKADRSRNKGIGADGVDAKTLG